MYTLKTDGATDTGDAKVITASGDEQNRSTPSGTIDLNTLTAKTTPVDADLTLIGDSASSFANKKSTFTNIKAFLKTYFDTLYQTVSTALLKSNNLSDLANVATAKTNLSLNNVDNTSDVNKPVSTAQATAIGLKVAKQTLTDNAIVRADGTAGEVQNSGITIDDSNNIVLPTTASGATTGIIYKGSNRYIHNWRGTGDDGYNLFIGVDSGNFTMVHTASNTYEASYNTAIGDRTLQSNTTGYNNAAIGTDALKLNTTGRQNFGMGAFALSKNVTGINNTAVGYSALLNCTGSTNIAIGSKADELGTTGSSNIIIGFDIDPSANNASNELNIGGVIQGTGMYGTGKIGINTTPTARLHLPAGATGANTAPLKLTTGSLNTTAEAGAIEFLTDQIYFTQTQNALRKEIVLREATRVTTQFDKVNATLANVTGLTATLGAGKTYKFKAVLFVDCDVVGGQKYAIAGTATATNIIFQINSYDNSTNVNTINSRQSALAGSAGQAGTAVAYTEITGTITCNATGTLTVQFAQNTASGTSSILVGSSFTVENIL
jgi:hypothetical protein